MMKEVITYLTGDKFMSVWNDIRKRSNGSEIKKEDEYQNIQEFSDIVNPLIYVGIINQSAIPSHPETGQIYYVQDTVSINGITFPSGGMILFDGNNWYNIGIFQETKIDSNIGYYQPVDAQ